jgi:hypothetical protein
MLTVPRGSWPRTILLCAVSAAIIYVAHLQLICPVFYDPDSYYNMAVSAIIKNQGFHYQFHWAQFSVFTVNFADKDFLLHVISLPFLYCAHNPVTAGKYALIFCTALFFIAYAFVMWKHAPKPLAAVFLLLPLSSPLFTMYLLQLRSMTPAIILTILGVYWLIKKRPARLVAISALLALTHASFLIFVIIAVACEALRSKSNGGFFTKNIYAVIGGSALGLLIHPNFPNNIFLMYLNGVVVALYLLKGIDLGFSGELMAISTRSAFISNFALFFCLGIILWAALLTRKKAGVASCCWLAASSIFLLLAAFSSRYWYQANILFFIFCASYAGDMLEGIHWHGNPAAIYSSIAVCAVVLLIFLPLNMRELTRIRTFLAENSANRENAGRWMQQHIPENQTIYHSYWDDSAYFMCLNPKDNYINTNDPVYMFYRFPKEFEIMEPLSMGRIGNPREVFEKIFNARYGYVRKQEPLYRQIAGDPADFDIMYRDTADVIFKTTSPPTP